MVGITEAGAALSGLKAAYDMAKGLQALTGDAQVKMATIDLMSTILAAQQSALEAQEAQSRMLRRIDELEAELAANGSWDQEKRRYELREFPKGTFAYVLSAEAANGEPQHRLCPHCFEQGRKSILQVDAKHSGGETVRCHPCGARITISDFSHRMVRNDRGSAWP